MDRTITKQKQASRGEAVMPDNPIRSCGSCVWAGSLMRSYGVSTRCLHPQMGEVVMPMMVDGVPFSCVAFTEKTPESVAAAKARLFPTVWDGQFR